VGKSSGPCSAVTFQALVTANLPSNAKITLKTVVFDGMIASVDTVIKNIEAENIFLRPIYFRAKAHMKAEGNSTSPESKNVM
jgi:hypothetical protein